MVIFSSDGGIFQGLNLEVMHDCLLTIRNYSIGFIMMCDSLKDYDVNALPILGNFFTACEIRQGIYYEVKMSPAKEWHILKHVTYHITSPSVFRIIFAVNFCLF